MFVVCLGFFWKHSVFPAIILSFETAVFSIGLIYIYRIIKTKKSEQNTLPPYIYESFSVSTVIINSSECLNSKHAACYDIHKRLKCHFEGNHKKHVVVTSFWKTIIGVFFMFLVFSCFFFFLILKAHEVLCYMSIHFFSKKFSAVRFVTTTIIFSKDNEL